ncbi:hypothetical protein EV182_003158 [Spiromyces aspiralis]|uniref:Uncharacterized protein n=1 Tax=Spiromyces aspiralis TaxID=68401 RepID=A0ACC1HHB8_9FUNG|nr:hypothetical protein EV182_003158 [Spiromyces aspiralis]
MIDAGAEMPPRRLYDALMLTLGGHRVQSIDYIVTEVPNATTAVQQGQRTECGDGVGPFVVAEGCLGIPVSCIVPLYRYAWQTFVELRDRTGGGSGEEDLEGSVTPKLMSFGTTGE